MKNLVLFVLAGMLILSFGCPGEEAAPEAPAAPESPETPAEPAENASTIIPTAQENITQCADGTKVGACSVTKPKICDVYGNLVDDAESCGCPENSLKAGKTCIYNCEDGTPIGHCSTTQPKYCNADANLIDKASECGCPPGHDVHGETCRNSCEDGTPKNTCSTVAPPYYCDSEYNLTMNPVLCGCHVGEFLLEGECFAPWGQTYFQGETIRITEDVSMKVERIEEKSCKDGTYVSLTLTVSNVGKEPVEINQEMFKLFKDDATRAYAETPSGGCTVANLYKWGEVNDGETESGVAWFKVIGGSGTYHIEYAHQYSPSVIKDFTIYVGEEDMPPGKED